MNFKRRWQWFPRKWFVMVTMNQGWGLGFAVSPPLKYNGADFYLGPFILTIQPPAPAWAKGE